MWSATQIPHILKTLAAAADRGIPEHKMRVIAPDVGGGFGGKLQVTPEEILVLAASVKLGKPVKYTETRSESLLSAHHGRDQIQDITIAAKPRRHRHRAGRRPARRHGRLPAPGDVGHPDPRRVHVQLDLQVPGLPVRLHERVHHQDPHRRLPRRRPAGGDVRHRADHGRARGRAGPRAAGAARAELDQARGVPVHHGVRAGVRLRQLRGRHRQGQGAVRLRRAARASSRSGATRDDPVQLGIGISTFTEMCGLAPCRVLGSLAYGAGGWETRVDPDAADRQGRGRHRVVRRTGRATRRRGARSSPTSSACRSRTSRCCTATPRSPRGAWTPTARGRWPSAGSPWSRPRRRWSRRPGRSPRTCSRRPRTTWSSPAAGSGSGAPARA